MRPWFEDYPDLFETERAELEALGLVLDEQLDAALGVVREACERAQSAAPSETPEVPLGPGDVYLEVHRRIAGAREVAELMELRRELDDRFGELPEAARALLECHRVRIAARPLGVARVDATHEAVQLQFVKNPPIDGARVIEFIRKKGRGARLAGPEKLRVEAKLPAWQERAQAVTDILQQLAA